MYLPEVEAVPRVGANIQNRSNAAITRNQTMRYRQPKILPNDHIKIS
jgi:hypothetical protein